MYTINILLKLLGEPRHLGLYLLSLSFYALQFITQFKYFFAAIGFVPLQSVLFNFISSGVSVAPHPRKTQCHPAAYVLICIEAERL